MYQFTFWVMSTISIHALVKRATEYLKLLRENVFDFNPRPREEGDYKIVYKSNFF